MKVEFSEEAKRQARKERAWWRKHRDAKHLFMEELRAARDALSNAPKHEIYGYFDGEAVRRLLLEKTQHAPSMRGGGHQEMSLRSSVFDYDELQVERLKREGVRFVAGVIPLERFQWRPRAG